MINLYNQDCLEAMKKMDDNSYDLSIVDPPYGINWMKNVTNKDNSRNWKQYEYKNWDEKIPSKEYFEQLIRVSKNQIIWGGNYFLDFLNATPCFLIWNKCQQFKGAEFEMAWTSFGSPSKFFNMSRVMAYKFETKIHPIQKPVALYAWILSNYAKEGDRILDTHLGSGSIAIACHNLGFHLDGYELDVDYYEAATKRLKEHQRQLKLF